MITRILKGLGEALLCILGFALALGLLFFGAIFALICLSIIGIVFICCPWLAIFVVIILLATD